MIMNVNDIGPITRASIDSMKTVVGGKGDRKEFLANLQEAHRLADRLLEILNDFGKELERQRTN